MLDQLNIKKGELKLIFIVSLLIIIFTSAPYLYGYFTTPDNQTYLGLHLAAADIFVYESYINQVKDGGFLIENLFTNDLPPEKHFNIFWLMVGTFAKIFSLSAIFAMHLFRVLLIPISLILIYLFISYFFTEIKKRFTAFLLISFSSGLGGIAASFLYKDKVRLWPMDLWVSESNTFLTFYQSAHYIASISLMFAIFFLFLLSLENGKKKYPLIGGISALLYFNFHPYYLLTIFSVVGAYLLILLLRKERAKFVKGLKYIFILAVISLPAIIYHGYKFIFDPITKAKAPQNSCPTAILPITIISYGLPLFLALYAIYHTIKNKTNIDHKKLFVIVWLIVNFILIYVPFISFQRKLTEGMQFPIVILATSGIFIFLEKIKKSKNILVAEIKTNKYLKYLFLIPMVFIFISSNIYVLTENFVVANQKLNYMHNDYKESMEWLKDNTQKDETILAQFVNGNIIPSISNRKVYLGHWSETPNRMEKMDIVAWFFKENNEDQQKKEFLKNSRVNYIFFSPMEDGLGNFDPDTKNYLKKIYTNDNIRIYKFTD